MDNREPLAEMLAAHSVLVFLKNVGVTMMALFPHLPDSNFIFRIFETWY